MKKKIEYELQIRLSGKITIFGKKEEAFPPHIVVKYIDDKGRNVTRFLAEFYNDECMDIFLENISQMTDLWLSNLRTD